MSSPERRNEIDRTITALHDAWHANPSLRLVQLVCNTSGMQVDPRLYNIGDGWVEDAMSAYAEGRRLFTPEPPDDPDDLSTRLRALLDEYDRSVTPGLFTSERALRERVGNLIGADSPVLP